MSRAGDQEAGTSALPFPRLLLTGPPQCGKTTVVRRLVEAFPGRAAGFYTREVRRRGQRVGFEIVTLEGQAAWLAHIEFPGPRVGRYGVDVTGFEAAALPALAWQRGIDLLVVDEIGKMECLSAAFKAALERLWDAPAPLVATVALKGGGFIARVKTWPGASVVEVTSANRDALPGQLLAMVSACGNK